MSVSFLSSRLFLWLVSLSLAAMASGCSLSSVHSRSSVTPLLSDEVVLDLGHFTTASLHHYLLGQRATEDEDYELAIREFRLGLVHDQSTSELYEALSDVLVRQGHFSRAVEALESGLGRVSNEDRLKVALLSLHWRLRDFEALVLVHSSIKNQELSMDVTILPMLVDALMWSKQFEAAERVVDAALSAGDCLSTVSARALCPGGRHFRRGLG